MMRHTGTHETKMDKWIHNHHPITNFFCMLFLKDYMFMNINNEILQMLFLYDEMNNGWNDPIATMMMDVILLNRTFIGASHVQIKHIIGECFFFSSFCFCFDYHKCFKK